MSLRVYFHLSPPARAWNRGLWVEKLTGRLRGLIFLVERPIFLLVKLSGRVDTENYEYFVLAMLSVYIYPVLF